MRYTVVLVIILLSPACGRGREIIKRLPYMRASMRPSMIHPFVTFLQIFKFAGNVYSFENMSVQNFGLILKNKMAA